MNEKHFSSFLIGGVALLVLISLINSATIFSLGSKMDKKVSDLKEAARPAQMQLTILSADCEGCTDISPLVDSIRQNGRINLTSEKILTPTEGSLLISKFQITRLPALVLEGETDRIAVQNLEIKDGSLVFDRISPPYYSIASGKVEGNVDAWVLTSAKCQKCPDLNEIITLFSTQGVSFSSTSTLSSDDGDAKNLIAEHGITKLPAILFSNDIKAYPEVMSVMKQGGFMELGNAQVYESEIPYYNLSSGAVRGLVDVTYLTDSSCKECYNATIHKQILERFGITVGEEKNLDVSFGEGKSLVSSYRIDSIPTILLTGDMKLYAGFGEVWESVGTIETDGSFLFRNNGVLSEEFSYKNLTTGQIVKPAPVPSQG